MLLQTLTGSDDYRVKGRRGTYIIIQVDDGAYEILLQNSETHCRCVGYATSKRQAEREIKRIDAL